MDTDELTERIQTLVELLQEIADNGDRHDRSTQLAADALKRFALDQPDPKENRP